MQKIIFTLGLFIFIIFMITVSVFFVAFNFLPENNFLNNNFRKYALQNLYLRSFFKLYQIGDARYDFTADTNFKKMNIIIYSRNNEVLGSNIQTKLREKLKEIINKPEGITFREETIEIDNLVNDNDLLSFLKSYPIEFKDSATLHLFLLNSYEPKPSYAGLVKDAYTIFLFQDALQNIAHFEKNPDNAIISTILHEFAHLLGAGHVSKDGCILSAKVEDTAYGIPQKITTDFCPADLAEIRHTASL